MSDSQHSQRYNTNKVTVFSPALVKWPDCTKNAGIVDKAVVVKGFR